MYYTLTCLYYAISHVEFICYIEELYMYTTLFTVPEFCTKFSYFAIYFLNCTNNLTWKNDQN
jgi:hypothetical protein